MANKPQTRLNFYKGYGKNFKRIRIENNLTLESLSEIINFSVKTISAIENESRVPTIEQLNIYTEKFNVPLDFLTGRIKTMSIDISLICEYTGLSENAVKLLSNLNSSSIKEIESLELIKRYSENKNSDLFRFALRHNFNDDNVKAPKIKAYSLLDTINLLIGNYDESNLSILSIIKDIINLKYLKDNKYTIGFNGNLYPYAESKLEGVNGYMINVNEMLESKLFFDLQSKLKDISKSE